MPQIRGSSYDDGRVQTIRGDVPRGFPGAAGPVRAQVAHEPGLASPVRDAPAGTEPPGLWGHVVHKARHAFWGAGPKGYRRSDERILEDVCEALGALHPDAREIEVLVQDGEVTLGGHVRSRSEKWLAEDIAEDVLGVREVHNRLRTAP